MERERGEAAVELADGASVRGQLQEEVGGQERRKGRGLSLQEGKGQADRLLYEGCLRWLQWSLGGKELLRNGIDVRIHNRFLKIGKLPDICKIEPPGGWRDARNSAPAEPGTSAIHHHRSAEGEPTPHF